MINLLLWPIRKFKYWFAQKMLAREKLKAWNCLWDKHFPNGAEQETYWACLSEDDWSDQMIIDFGLEQDMDAIHAFRADYKRAIGE